MKKTMLALAGLALVGALAGGAQAQDKKILAVVVKGLDNPFFTVMGQGCADWNTAHADSEYTCLYTGPDAPPVASDFLHPSPAHRHGSVK